MAEHMSWRIVMRSRSAAVSAGVPASVVTIGPGFHHESMPAEIAILLPTNEGPVRLIDHAVDDPALCTDAMLGLFLASPFLNVALESARLHQAGVGWVVNLPSVDQQDEEFSRQLPDVGLDAGRELERLARFRDSGFKIAAAVTDARGACAAAAIAPDALIVLPRVGDFAAGFPSLRQRSTAAHSVAEAAGGAGWSGILLGLCETREADSEELWPSSLDGLVCRPVAG